MDRQELFLKYNINESHSEWDYSIDNWMSKELYMIMHNGNLPTQNDNSVKWIIDFLDKAINDNNFYMELRKRKQNDFGSLFLTAKRLVYSLADKIIEEYS